MDTINKCYYYTYNIAPRSSGCGCCGRSSIGVGGGVIWVVAGAVVE
jgi:hypothetical protein